MKTIQKKIWLIPLLALCLVNFQCKKNKTETPKTELEKLPPITQTGANTFGCLVNGIAWLPNGTKPNNGAPNIQVYVDPTFQGGKFGVSGHKYKDPEGDISVGSGKCTSGGYFTIDNSPLNLFNVLQYSYYSGYNILELQSNEIGTYSKGFLNITRYDLNNGIFSGTFECVFYNPTKIVDTLKITNGRFDVKL